MDDSINDSLSLEQARAYARAFHHAVVDRDLPFTTADQFADWYARVGRHFHGTPQAALDGWLEGRERR